MFFLDYSPVADSGRLTWVRAALPIPSSVWSIFLCPHYGVYTCRCFGLLTCAQILMHAIAHAGCTRTVGVSAVAANSVRKFPYCTGISNPGLRLVFRSDA